jgi:uncharacterized protein YuzE
MDVELEVTFRRGSPLAAYIHLPNRAGQKSFRTQRVEPGVVIDFNRRGEPIGVEIITPSNITLAAVNRVFRSLGLPPLKKADIAPLLAA